MSTNQDQAKLIAERVARRIKGTDTQASTPSSAFTKSRNGSPLREELAQIRDGLQDLENKLDRIESRIVQTGAESTGASRARVIDFVSPGPPVVTPRKVVEARPDLSQPASPRLATTSPWLAGLSGQYQRSEMYPYALPSDPKVLSHPSQERFGVEEAAVSELVEFFENEKKCSLDPSGKPCDHCAMCSSRGF